MAEGTIIRRQDLKLATGASDEAFASPRGEPAAASAAATFEVESLTEARDQWTRAFLTKALTRHAGKRAETAKALGIGERTLFRYIEQLAISDD
jgi:DNA-binding NtrC family response regulator